MVTATKTSLKKWSLIVSNLILSSTKREIRHFHVVVVQQWLRNVKKKRDAHAKLLLCQSKPIGFFLFSSPSSLLKLLNIIRPTPDKDYLTLRKRMVILHFTLLLQYCSLLLLRILIELSYTYLDDVHVNLVLIMLALSIMPMLDKYKLKQVF